VPSGEATGVSTSHPGYPISQSYSTSSHIYPLHWYLALALAPAELR